MSKGQDQQQDQKNIDTVLSSEANALTKMQNAIGELLEANQQLKDSVELKQQVDALKKEAPSLPWFKRLVQIIPQVKYLFIKNDEQIAAERREINREILTYVDNTLTKVGKKSSSLQVIIDKELQIGLEKVIHKGLSEEQLTRVGKLQEHLSSLDVSQKDYRAIVPKVYNANEAAALIQEKTQLTQIQQDITNLVDANSKVQGLLAIKKELAELRQELPSTWLDNLNKSIAKIKDAFVKNPEQILKDTVNKNNITLQHVDNALKTTGKIIESSKLARKNKLHKELENLKERKLLPDQLERVTSLSSAIDSTFAKTIAISGPLFTMDQEQTQSQPLYSSMPNLQTTSLRSAPPPPPLANTSLPNLAVRQQNIAETIPPAPSIAGHSTQQIMAGSMPPRPTRPAPPPPTQTMSLQNPATQQPNVAPAVIPPAPPPPPPPHEVPGLQQGAHQVGTQVVPPLAAELSIPTPPPLPPMGGFNPPPPPPAPTAGQPKNPAANPIEGQGNRGQLLEEIATGVTLKKVEVVDKTPTRDDLFAAIEAGREDGFKLKHVDKIDKTKEVTKKPVGFQEIMEEAIKKRRVSFEMDDDDDAHDPAEQMKLIKEELVKFIDNEKVNESSLISKLHAEFLDAKDIKSKEELVTFVNDDFSDWGENDQVKENKQNEIIDKLKNIKKQHEKGSLDLSAKPVVDAAKGEIPTSLAAVAQAIGQTIPKPENVTGQANKSPPAPPPLPKIRPAGGQGK